MRSHRFSMLLGLYLLAVFILVSWLDQYRMVTELAPHRPLFWIVGLVVGTMCGLAIAIFYGGGQNWGLRAFLIIGCGAIGAIPGLQMGEIVQARQHFPQGRTRHFTAFLLIAYADRGRNASYSHPDHGINVKVTAADYRWMVSNERYRSIMPGGIGRSHRFCERVEIEQSGPFLAVMNAGSHELPTGSIGFCDEMHAREPTLPMVSYLDGALTVD